MTSEIEIAKQKRKAARATYSKTVNKLQEILAAESPDVDDLEIHLDQLTEKFKDLKTSDEIFLNLLQKKTGITQVEYEKEYEIAQDYYEKLSTFNIKVKKAIASAEKENGSSASPNPTWRPADGAHAATKAKQNLPEIRLPQFDGQLRQQSIKIYNTQPIKVDEIVLLEDNNKRRSYWNLARVLKVIPGRDGQIRLALIKTENSELLRPVQRLYRLELENPVVKTGDEPIPLTTSSGRVVKTPAK
ncbi:integrase catalytic domain-containing protein [Nephila pilipes]|uniref:Integrase catalytic domain-containing protein n=1 Tax=Nephila pilipes TaxID=299642 RepID=A0A8X6N5M4_NEPPI|nr:integrase catalytic domain-containing protein [Nephila pilipes]GFS95538.1 integrase catalytic domain-containing protein [Nephila pilipes]